MTCSVLYLLSNAGSFFCRKCKWSTKDLWTEWSFWVVTIRKLSTINIYIFKKTVYINMRFSLIQNCILPLTSFYSRVVSSSLLRSPVTRPCVNKKKKNLIWLWTERCWTLLVVEQQASFLQHQGEAVLPVSLCMEQRPGIPQGFKLQRDHFLPRRARPHAQSVDQAAAAIKAGHIMSCGIEGGPLLTKRHTVLGFNIFELQWTCGQNVKQNPKCLNSSWLKDLLYWQP